MEILGIGPSELIFIIIIALIVLGPKDMQKAGKTIGQYLNKLVRSDGWKAFQQTSRELRNLPTNLMREANLDLAETEKEIRKSMKMPPLPSNSKLSQPQEAENSIEPPSATKPAADESNITIDTPDTPDDKASSSDQNA
jgi:sec-independent protein translocase protein TatB